MESRPARRPARSSTALARLLLVAGAVGTDELAEALDEQRRTGARLEQVLTRRGLAPDQVALVLARQLRLPYARPPLRPEPRALAVLDGELATRLRLLPLRLTRGGLRVAMADPLDRAAVDDIQFRTGHRVEPVVASGPAVDRALVRAYGPRDAGRAPHPSRNGPAPARGHGGTPGPEPEDPIELRRASEAAPVIDLVDRMFERAVRCGASDVHVEPLGSGLRVRARVDGYLRELLTVPREAAAVVSRIKIMAGLDISVKLRPQDGRCDLAIDGRSLALRVSTLPVAGGEKVVIRILESGSLVLGLTDLGLGALELDKLQRLLGRAHGAVLVTGPTGSGKTTTLYAALASLDRERRNVVTLEDPIEYRLPGLTQVQIHARAGLTFAAALRAVLRQDPDVIMVGEMRDGETVSVGLAAALTGHLVLSTLHTNDAASAVTRLHEMGAAPYLIAGGLAGVVAQRLVRRLCRHCRKRAGGSAAPGDPLLRAGPAPYQPTGCRRCGETGYRGRIGLFEVLAVDERIRELVLTRASAAEIRDAACDAGMRTLAEDARRKVDSGHTSLEEVSPLLALADEEARTCGCGGRLRDEFRHCPGCSRHLVQHCACGARLEEGWHYCPACGCGTGPEVPAQRNEPRSEPEG